MKAAGFVGVLVGLAFLGNASALLPTQAAPEADHCGGIAPVIASCTTSLIYAGMPYARANCVFYYGFDCFVGSIVVHAIPEPGSTGGYTLTCDIVPGLGGVCASEGSPVFDGPFTMQCSAQASASLAVPTVGSWECGVDL